MSTPASATSVADLRALFGSWQLFLRAERKTAGTIKTYGAGAGQYLDWCARKSVV